MSPTTCPECDGNNVVSLTSGSRRRLSVGRALIRRKKCVDCGFEASTVEFWVIGAAVTTALDLAGEDDTDAAA